MTTPTRTSFDLKFFRVFSKKKRHTGEFHYFSFFTIKVNMVILLIVSLFPPLYAGYQRFFSAPGCFGVGRRPKSIDRKPCMKSLWCPGYRHCDICCLRPRPHVSGHFWIRSRERKILTDAKSGCFFIRWRNNIERSSLPWILYSRWQPRCQVLSRQSTMQILRACFYSLATHALLPIFPTHALLPIFPAEFWVLEWSRIRVGYVWTGKSDLTTDTCERGNFWIRKEKGCGYKNIRMHVDGAENS